MADVAPELEPAGLQRLLRIELAPAEGGGDVPGLEQGDIGRRGFPGMDPEASVVEHEVVTDLIAVGHDLLNRELNAGRHDGLLSRRVERLDPFRGEEPDHCAAGYRG